MLITDNKSISLRCLLYTFRYILRYLRRLLYFILPINAYNKFSYSSNIIISRLTPKRTSKIKSKSWNHVWKARSRKLVVPKNCKKMQMTRVKGVKSKRVNRAHARTGTCSCTGSKRGYVTHRRRSRTREEGLVFVRCEDTRERRFSLLNVNVFVSRPLHPAKPFSLA